MTRHLVVRAPNWVGDLTMATATLEAARTSRLFEQVTVLVRPHLASVLADGPLERHVVPIEGEETSVLRGLRADAVLLLTNSLGAAWRAWRARIPVRAGIALSGRGRLLTHRVLPPRRDGRRVPVPTVHLHRDAAGLLGIQVPDLSPRLFVRDEVRDRAAGLLRGLGLGLGEGEGFVLCIPGAAFGAAKLWPPERFAAALDELHDRLGLRGVIGGAPAEEPLMRFVAQRCRHPVVSLADEERDLEQLKALAALARLVLVGDSGPRWFAAAFGVPCVTVMGPNFPQLTENDFEEVGEVVRLDHLECAPCLERRCPLGHHRCLRDLPVEPVLAAAERVLARVGGLHAPA